MGICHLLKNSIDNILCVGSVLNYCDAIAAISEFNRVLKYNGHLILEYESSWGFEYIGKKCYKSDACIITTEYIEKEHTQWLYSHFRLNNCSYCAKLALMMKNSSILFLSIKYVLLLSSVHDTLQQPFSSQTPQRKDWVFVLHVQCHNHKPEQKKTLPLTFHLRRYPFCIL